MMLLWSFIKKAGTRVAHARVGVPEPRCARSRDMKVSETPGRNLLGDAMNIAPTQKNLPGVHTDNAVLWKN